jgi:hypothetical protein
MFLAATREPPQLSLPSCPHRSFRGVPVASFFAPFFAENEQRADRPAGPRLFGVEANEVRQDGDAPTKASARGRPDLDDLYRGGAGRGNPHRARTRRRTDGLRTAARTRRWLQIQEYARVRARESASLKSHRRWWPITADQHAYCNWC